MQEPEGISYPPPTRPPRIEGATEATTRIRCGSWFEVVVVLCRRGRTCERGDAAAFELERIRAVARAWRAPEPCLQGRAHSPLETLGVTRIKPGQRDDLVELVTVALDPAQHCVSLLFRAMAHVQHRPAQHGNPQNLFGPPGRNNRRGKVESTFQNSYAVPSGTVRQFQNTDDRHVAWRFQASCGTQENNSGRRPPRCVPAKESAACKGNRAATLRASEAAGAAIDCSTLAPAVPRYQVRVRVSGLKSSLWVSSGFPTFTPSTRSDSFTAYCCMQC